MPDTPVTDSTTPVPAHSLFGLQPFVPSLQKVVLNMLVQAGKNDVVDCVCMCMYVCMYVCLYVCMYGWYVC